MESSLRRWFGVVALCGAGIAVWLQARGFALLLSAFALGGPPRTPPRAAPTVPALAEAKGLSRRAEEPVVPPTRAAALDPLSWPECRDVRLSIVTQFNDPWSSRVTLHEVGTEGARFTRIGDQVAGKKLAFIGQNPRSLMPSVWLEAGEQSCQAALFAEASTAPIEQTSTSVAPLAIAGLRRLSDTEVEADRELAEKALGNPLEAFGRVRLVPERQDGSVRGLRLFGIARGSLLDGLGLKNGDRLDSINGYDLADPERAIAAYARLRTATRLTILAQRGGKPLELSVRIR